MLAIMVEKKRGHVNLTLIKPITLVFSDHKTEMFSFVDEGWTLKKTPVLVGPKAFIVDMGRKIGTQGNKDSNCG